MSCVYIVVGDMFFADRLANGLRQAGHDGRVLDLSMESPSAIPPGTDLVIADLEAGETALRLVREARTAGIPVLAFGPHTDLALREQGLAAGANKVVAKSKLTSAFAGLIAEMTAAR